MKQTKEQLQKTNIILAEKIKIIEQEDYERRKVLSELLGSYEYVSEYGYSSKNKKEINVRDWLGISYLIGELKSDADYSCLLEGREMLRAENEELKQQLYKLTHPEEKKV